MILVMATQHDKNKDKEIDALELLTQKRDTAFKRFPLVLTLLGTFGLVSTLYGVQHIFDRIPILANNPIISLGVGLLILILTGTLYKKLG
jgi:hypothetical protein